MSMNDILDFAMRSGASDLFITAGKVPCVRLNGKLQLLDLPPTTIEEVDSFRTSFFPPDVEKEFRTTGSADAAFAMDLKRRFRLNFLTACGVPGFVARPIRCGDELDFASLNLPVDILTELAHKPRGLVLICGAAGSGKSTTLSAIVNEINRTMARHVVMIEDPIEYLHFDRKSVVTQREVGRDTDSFAEALKNALRESPDVIVIGEMRDLDTMQTAIAAALTGHLVLSTVHTGETSLAIERIINYFPDNLRETAATDVALALQGVIAQRLLPRSDGNGMIPAVEILLGTTLVRDLIAKRQFNELDNAIKNGNESGMVTFNRAIFTRVKEGSVRKEDALNAVDNREEFLLLERGMESGVDAFRYRLDADIDVDLELDMKQLLRSALGNNASDLLLTTGAHPTVRVNGALVPLDAPVLDSGDTQKLLYSILSARQRAYLEANREIDFSLSIKLRPSGSAADATPEEYRFRVNGFFQRGAVGAAIRVIPHEIPAPAQLGIPAALVRMMDRRSGLIIVTGPTGHGKTTTLASLIDVINRRHPHHIVTIEDPIEYVHNNIRSIVEQRELQADTLSFPAALKYVLRQDPDVIMVGEMRDCETMAAALTAAETGHLVLATLHTGSAPQSIDRIVDSFPQHQQNQIRVQLAGSLLAVVSQRLLERADKPGRIAAFELMVGTPAICALIRDGKTSQLQSSMETSARDGMVTMDHALEELLSAGKISKSTFDTVYRNYRTVKEY